MNTRLLLVRHGQTAWNAAARFMGQLDVPLDATGRIQAQAVARRLAAEKPAAIYGSALGRARETALAIQAAIASHPEVRIEDRLNEMKFGDWEGKTYAEIKREDPENLARWESEHFYISPPGGESLPVFARRIRAAYDDICAAHGEETVIIAGHGGSLQVMLALALDMRPESFQKFRLSNASLSELGVYESGAVLHRLNDIGHLSEIGLPDVSDSP